MKKLHLSILICVVLCAVLALVLVGCNANALARPENVKLDGPTLTLSWRGNNSARYYIVNISGNGVNEDKNTRSTSFSIANLGLKAGDYQLKVKACGDGKDFKDSPWSKTIYFSQDNDTGLSFKFINNNKEVEVIGIGRASGEVVIPDTYRSIPVTSIGDRAFSGKSKLTGIVLGSNIERVGANAFFNCTQLKSVKFSNKITTIGESAFKSCKLLEGVLEIPRNVKEIGASAFAYCTALTGVKLNQNLEMIGELAFEACTEFTAIEIPNSVQYIGGSAFFGCKKVISVKFGTGLKQIGEYAFASCDALESVRFNEGLLSIGDYSFGRCAKLTTVEFSDSVQYIGKGAFYQSPLLANVTFGTGINRVGNGAFLETAIWNNTTENEVYLCNWFLGCKKNDVAKVTIKDGTIGLANSSLAGFENLTELVQLPNSVKIIGDGVFATSKVTQVIIGSGVEEIGVQAFYGCEMLSMVILGDFDFGDRVMTDSSLKVINENAFMGCTRLEDIDIPSSVETINSYAFNGSALYKNSLDGIVYAGNWVVGCDNTRANGTIIIENGTVGIANYAFYKCDKITGAVISNTVKTIGRAAFYQCTALENVSLPNELEVIDDYTFYGCTNLVLPKLPQTLKTIGRSAFYKCALKNEDGEDTENDVLVIPNSVETIGDYAFFGCGYTLNDPIMNMVIAKCGIDMVQIGNGVREIGANAFNTIATLKTVIFGNGVRTLGDKAFYQCESLETVIFNRGLQSIGARAFYGCNSLKEITLPDGLFEIGNYAFYRCQGLEKVYFGENVRTVGNYAFYGCSALSELYLPDSLRTIGQQAFRSCTGLTSVILKSGLTSIADHAFYGCKSLTIYAQDNGPKEGWSERFNSGYRPVIWGCTIVDGYVHSVTKTANTVENLNATNSLSAPQRDGYTFVGWSTSEGATTAEYSMANIVNVKDGTRLYAVWKEVENN